MMFYYTVWASREGYEKLLSMPDTTLVSVQPTYYDHTLVIALKCRLTEEQLRCTPGICEVHDWFADDEYEGEDSEDPMSDYDGPSSVDAAEREDDMEEDPDYDPNSMFDPSWSMPASYLEDPESGDEEDQPSFKKRALSPAPHSPVLPRHPLSVTNTAPVRMIDRPPYESVGVYKCEVCGREFTSQAADSTVARARCIGCL